MTFMRKILSIALGIGPCLLGFLFPQLFAQTQAVRFERLSIDNGLSNSYVTCILQDQLGFMWFGTQDGLNKYDGYQFTVYKHDPSNVNSLSDNFICSIYEGQGGVLWIGTENGGICRFDFNTGTFIRYRHEPGNANSLASNHIRVIYVDRSGKVWIGTDGSGLDQFDPQTGTFRHYRADPVNSKGLSHDVVNTIYNDPDTSRNILWIGTSNGLNRYDPSNGEWTRFYRDPKNPNSLSSSHVLQIYCGREGQMWIATAQGLNRLDTKTLALQRVTLPGTDRKGHNIQTLCEDQDGNLWIGSYLGVEKYTPNAPVQEQLKSYKYQSGDPYSISVDAITTIYRDRSGILWFGTAGGGVCKLNPSAGYFRYYRHIPGDRNSLSHPSVRGIFEDDEGILWVGGYGGLNRIDRRTGRFRHYRRTNATNHQLDSDVIYSILGDPDDNRLLWIGTEGNGLYRFNKITGKARHFRKELPSTAMTPHQSISGNYVFDLFLDSRGDLWIATNNGLNRLDRGTGVFTWYRHVPGDPRSISSNAVRVITEDRDGYLWVGTETNGLNRLDRATGQFTRLNHDPDDFQSLSNNRVKCIYEDHLGRLWIGTNGGGLNRLVPDAGKQSMPRFKHYTQKDGLPNDVVYGILEDDEGHLWLSTNRGLSHFDPEREVFRNYDVHDGLQSNEFNTASYFRSRSGEMFFGGINGLTAFFPWEIKQSSYIPPVVITDFRISNQPVTIGLSADGRQILRKHISAAKQIFLSYKDYLISFEFAALSYAAPEKNRYAYKMEGFDDDWLYTDANKRFATYTNLPPGNYVFKVKGTNNDGTWNETGASVRLVITPPPWKAWWAYLLYIGLIGGSLYAVVRFQTRHERLKHQLQIEHMEAEKLQELDRMKSHFFANLSHEFRTPLTLIRGPVEDVYHQRYGEVSGKARKQLGGALRQVDRLRKLIDELLDLARLEKEKLKLQACRGELNRFLRRIVDSFMATSRSRNIRLEFQTDTQDIYLFFDREKLENVMNNLISNALKFTPDGGRITVSVKDATQEDKDRGCSTFVTIRVSDSGMGIAQKHLKHVFERFYQVDDSSTRIYEGTGIGLAIVKEFVDLHGGEVTVESKVGVGTTFTVLLPKGSDHLSPHELLATEVPGTPEPPSKTTHAESEKGDTSTTGSSFNNVPGHKDTSVVLVVEDNVDMRAYLKEHLVSSYRVVEAGDGVAGLEAARKVLPDLVISDIMMPRMDGIDLCRALRQDDVLRNVPVILLTARAGEEDRLAGLEISADDYITKPFSPTELTLKIRNLIDIRRKLWQEFNRKTLALRSDEIPLDSVDKTFMDRVRTVVEEHLADKKFNVESLAQKVFLSRRQLERKLKDITGLTPADYIRQVRLVRAKQLLDKHAVSTVAETAYAVGFSKVEYFSLLFRATFGQSPGELIKNPERSTA